MLILLAAITSQPTLPLIGRLQHAHGEPQDLHVQNYPNRRRLQSASNALTRANTRPLRVLLDFASLEEQSAPEYSACFNAGDWFKRGLPEQQTPPTNGIETCSHTSSGGSSLTSGCWGICRAQDVIAPADRARVIEVVRILAAEVANLLAVTPTVDLAFTTSRGEYERALQSRGYDLPPACASDCSVLSGAAVDPQYCSGGLAHGYDAVLSVTKPPGIEGVAGTGSACAFDQVRRPLWLVLAWHSSIVGISQLSVNEAVDQYRAFVRHEMLHGLGFVNSMFFYARDSRGERKNLIEPRPVVDTDGARDEVWTFVRGRAYELAQHYFNCYGNATDPDASTRGWDGLPLMGLPEAGRGAHWETRILRDEVMSYGFRSIVSSITLAAMEDLGFYLANYSAAECMSWGHKQGCSYVRSRCGVGMHDQSHFFTPARLSQCRGDPYWASHPDSYLTSKCTSGNDPCSTSQQAGYDGAVTLPDGRRGAKCDSQCYYGDSGVSREGCSTPPSSEVEATGGDFLDSLRDNLSTVDWEAWILPAAVGVILLLGCMLLAFVRKCICPDSSNCRTYAYMLSGFLWLFAVAGLVGSGYLYIENEAFIAFVNLPSIYALAATCISVLLFTMLMMVALAWRAQCFLFLGFWLLILIAIAELIGIGIIAYWIFSLGGVGEDALESMFGSASSHIEGFLSDVFERPIAITEGIVCKTYQACCRDTELLDAIRPELGSGSLDVLVGSDSSALNASSSSFNFTFGVPRANHNATCLAPMQHEGATTDLELSLRDPSTANFCAYTSGAPRQLLITPPPATCLLVAQAASGDGFSLAQCRQDFCRTGTDGYLRFLSLITSLIRRYSAPLSGGAAVLVLVQLILACNLRNAAKLAKKERDMEREQAKVQGMIVVDDLVVADRPRGSTLRPKGAKARDFSTGVQLTTRKL